VSLQVQAGARINQPAPTVSVQIVVYNGARFLATTLDSLLSQTFSDFELIIVDDGSTDSTPAILESYAARESRIILLRNGDRLGISAARNRALAVSRGHYVAISDADDLSFPQRLQKEVDFLDAHAQIGVLGAYVSGIDEYGNELRKIVGPVESALIQWRLLFAPCIIHSSSMMRREILVQIGGYDVTKPYTVDYDLWLRLARITKFHTLAEELVAYRVHDDGVSGQNREGQYRLAVKLSRATITAHIGEAITFAEACALRALAIGEFTRSTELELRQATRLLQHIYHAYRQSTPLTPFEQRLIAADVAHNFRRLAAYQRRQGLWWEPLCNHWRAQRIRPYLPWRWFWRRIIPPVVLGRRLQ
jgi:GT2 family glycosyltransferase